MSKFIFIFGMHIMVRSLLMYTFESFNRVWWASRQCKIATRVSLCSSKNVEPKNICIKFMLHSASFLCGNIFSII